MTDEEKLIKAKIDDMLRLCDKYAKARFSQFYNQAEAEIVREYTSKVLGCNLSVYGGREGAERCMLGVFPQWEEPSDKEFPIACLKAEVGYDKKLSHRDYLGTILSLGIERGKVGDILVSERCAYIFVTEDIADYVEKNITKVANCGVKIKRTLPEKENLPEREFTLINTVAASCRLDAVLAAAINTSRRISSEYIMSGRVSVNHKLVLNGDFVLKKDDLLSIRGVGRIALREIGTSTRSGRIHILLEKSIR